MTATQTVTGSHPAAPVTRALRDVPNSHVGCVLTVPTLGGDPVTGVLERIVPAAGDQVRVELVHDHGWYRATLPGSYWATMHAAGATRNVHSPTRSQFTGSLQ